MRSRRMRRSAAALSLAVVLGGWSAGARADELYIVCHSDVRLLAAEIKDVFIGEKGFVGAVKLAPADNSAAQPAFLDKVLKINATKYAGVWTKKSFRDGVNPPPVKSSDAEALAYVKQTPGSCSYLGTAPGAGVNVIARL